MTDLNGQTRHKQVTIQWKYERKEVDEELAPLILALWKAGINPIASCQEDSPGIAWIEFISAGDAEKFLNLVAVYPDKADLRLVDGIEYYGDEPIWETLYGRIIRCGSHDDWRYTLAPFNCGVEEEIVNDEEVETCSGPSYFQFAVSVRFPRTDIPLILERVQTETKPSSSCSLFPELELKLLSIGGSGVESTPAPHLDMILERGRLFDPERQKRLEGEFQSSHQNAAFHYTRHHTLGSEKTCEIVTGYGLYKDGRWRRHSWLWDGASIIETHTNPSPYFGVILDPSDSVDFVLHELSSQLPGATVTR